MFNTTFPTKAIVININESKPSPIMVDSIGKLGIATVYSFHQNKVLSTGGEGGIIATNNYSVYKYCMSARDQGRSNDKNWLKHAILGFNYRMTEMQSTIGRVQLRRLLKVLIKRKKIVKIYNKYLEDNFQIKLIKKKYKR